MTGESTRPSRPYLTAVLLLLSAASPYEEEEEEEEDWETIIEG